LVEDATHHHRTPVPSSSEEYCHERIHHPPTDRRGPPTTSGIDAAAGLLARYGLVVIGWIGALKFTSFEAHGIQPLVANSPLMSWLYDIFSVRRSPPCWVPV